MKEEWKAVKGYEGLYEVSNSGEVRSLPRKAGNFHIKGRILKQYVVGNDYLCVSLSKAGYSKNHSVHRLVAEAFVENPEHKQQVNHKDEDKRNNRADNLEWVTQRENLNYGTRAERQQQTLAKAIGVPVIQIASDGHTAITEYDSISAAAAAVGASAGEIWDSVRKRNKCRNFYWRRKDSVTEHDLLFWAGTAERVSVTKTGK